MSTTQQMPFKSVENVNTFEPLFKERELKSAKSHLKHATEIHDKSAPLIEKDVHIKENHHKDLLAELHQPHHLKHADTQDKSAPVIDTSIHINQNHHKDLLAEIQQPHDLKHTETHDTSAPVIDSNLHIHRSTTLRLKENVAHAKDVIVENVEKAKEKLVENVTWAKEKLGEKAHNAKEVVSENVVSAKAGLRESAGKTKETLVEGFKENAEAVKETAGKTKETLVEGFKENAEAAKEKLAHNAAYAKVKLSNINAPGGVPVPPPSHPTQPMLPPQPTDKPHHEQAFTEKIVNQEFELHTPKENPEGTFPLPPTAPAQTFEQPPKHQQAFTKKIGTKEAKLSKGPVPIPPENQFTNPPHQPHEKAFTEQIVNPESKVSKTMQGEQSFQQKLPIE